VTEITLRIADEDLDYLQRYMAKYNPEGKNIADFVRDYVLEKIEDEMDLKALQIALEEFKENPTTYSHAEIGEMLGRNKVEAGVR